MPLANSPAARNPSGIRVFLAASILAVVLGMIFLVGIADAPRMATGRAVAVAAHDMNYGAIPSELYPAVLGV
jgi:hypothetical protein